MEAERLAAGELRDFRVGVLHGQMPSARQGRGDGGFASGETDVLVATTVIEVGIDVANATVMVIEGAERYGVSQLHQLRGRVGRGEHESHCLLFPEEAGELAPARLEAVAARATASGSPRSTSTLRGEGEVLGTRQHGLPRFAVAELPEDTPLLIEAREEVLALLRDHGSLDAPALGPLLDAAHRRFGAGAADPIPRVSAPAQDERRLVLRVIAGELKGQRLVAPRGWKVRPTSDRVREAIFSALGDRVAGARVLDLYCGTGALAIEALSRGAAAAVLVDRDTRPALGNVERLGLGERAELVRADVGRWLAAASARPRRGASTSSSSMPPIDSPTAWGRNSTPICPAFSPRAGGRSSRAAPARPLRLDSLEPLRQRRYGAADVSFYGRRRAR